MILCVWNIIYTSYICGGCIMKKRADGRYCKQVLVGYNSNGTRKMKSVYGKTIKEVEKKEREIQEKLAIGLNVIEDSVTIEEWSLKWLAVYKANVSRGTFAMYERCLKNHIIPTIGKIQISKLKTIQVQEVINDLIKKENIRTAEIYKLTLNQILKKAVEQEVVNKNVCLSLNKIKSKHEEKRVLTDFEKECISKTDYTDKERLFINLLYYTGIRRGEALALNIRDINHNTKMLKISKSLDIRENQPVLKEPKSKAGYREIPIPDVLYQEITKYFWKNKNINLFTMKNGELMSRTSFRKMWESIIKKTKATANDLFFCEQKTLNEYMDRTIAFTPHTFRHTYATNLYYAGIDIKRCQYLLGHSSIEMTLKIYTHLDNKNNDGYFGKINNYFDITKKIC